MMPFAMPRMSTLIRPVVTAVLLALGSAPATAANDPTAVVERFHESLLAVMKEARVLDARARYDRLAPSLEESFNLRQMIRIAAGTYWTQATEADRNRLTAAFKHLSISTYAARFDGYSGQTFHTLGTRPGPVGTLLVDTEIRSPGEPAVAITYVMRNAGDRWSVVDVLLEGGISELAVRRSEYSRVLRERGIEGLVADLDRKADDLIRH